MYKVKHYVNNQVLRMLYHSLINSRALYGIVAWERAASCHVQPISVVLNRAMRCLNPIEFLTNKVTAICDASDRQRVHISKGFIPLATLVRF